MKKNMVIIFLFILTINVFAATKQSHNDLANILKKLHKTYDNVVTFKSDFKQISFFKTVNQVQEYRGVLYLKKPDKMRWDYVQPEQQSIISNGKTIWYYYPAENQVNYAKLSDKSKEKNLIFILLEGMDKIERSFDSNIIKGSDNKHFEYLQLIPRHPNTDFNKIILTVSKKDYNIVTSHVYYVNGDISKVSFANSKMNMDLKDSIFNFVPPPGCEIFKMPTTYR